MGIIFRLTCALALGLPQLACSSSDDDTPVSGTGGAAGSGAGGSSSAGGHVGGAGSGASAGTSSTPGGSGMAMPGDPGEVGSCKMFPADDAWNLDISAVAADSAWTDKLQKLVGAAKIHPDYGVDGQDLYGIPLNVVPQTQALAPVSFDWYPEESDPGPYPFPGPDAVIIEGNSPRACDGDCHLLVVQQGTCMLYEGYACEYQTDGWHCGNGAKWDLTKPSYGQRQEGWTSADAAGLPIAPGVLRYDEVRAGEVTHALRFTLNCTADKYVKPATHEAVPDGCNPANGLPMGARVRLKADYDLSKLSPSAQVVLRGMQKYGMILADNGSNFYFQGQANPGWTDDDIEPLKQVPASAFEVVQMPPLMP
jgi:hypothetical protein